MSFSSCQQSIHTFTREKLSFSRLMQYKYRQQEFIRELDSQHSILLFKTLAFPIFTGTQILWTAMHGLIKIKLKLFSTWKHDNEWIERNSNNDSNLIPKIKIINILFSCISFVTIECIKFYFWIFLWDISMKLYFTGCICPKD